MRGAGADGPEVAMKPGNAGGAKGPDILASGHGQPAMGGAAARGKAYVIPKQLVWEAYQRVKANHGAAGVDGQSLAAFEKDLKGKLKTGATVEAAKEVGKLVAERAAKAGVKQVIFDRSGYLYHGRVKALADAAREGGLDF